MGKRSDVRVTTRSVIAAQPGSVTWDAEVKGFGVRVAPSGGRFYVLKYRVGSRQRWFTIGRHGSPWTAEQARIRAKALLARVVKGDDPSAERERERGNPVVADLARQFMAEHVSLKAKPRTAVEYGRVIDRFIVREFGRKRVMDVKAEDIAKLHHSLRMTPRQANITIIVGRKMFAMAELWGYRPPGANPCSQIERYREVRRERFLSHEEIARLGEALAHCEHGWTEKSLEAWKVACRDAALAAGKTLAQATAEAAARAPRRTEPEHPSAVAALRLLALTGARLSEVLGLTWKMFDSSERVLRLPDSKTGAKVIPLATPAVQVIEAQRPRRQDGNPYIFPGSAAGKPLADLQKPWQRIRGLAGLANARIHDLRHTLASHAVMRGMSLVMVGKILGHRSNATTARYAHFAADPVRQAADAASSSLVDLLRPPREDVYSFAAEPESRQG